MQGNIEVRSLIYANIKTGLYTVILGQYTETMKDKFKSHPEFTAAHQNGIALLKVIKLILYLFEEASHKEDEMMVMKKAFFSFTQGNNMSLQQYYELTLGQAAVLEEMGMTIADVAMAIKVAGERGCEGLPDEDDSTEARERALAIKHQPKVQYRMLNALVKQPAGWVATTTWKRLQRPTIPSSAGPPGVQLDWMVAKEWIL